MLSCRPTTTLDLPALLEVHRAAFSTDLEAELVSELLADRSAPSTTSWVGVVGTEVVGHVLLTAGAVPAAPELSVMLLCPLAVAPSHQHAGVGAALTQAALSAAATEGVQAVTVFGDPEYYTRFGFQPLLPAGPLPPFDVAEAHRSAWQTLVVDRAADVEQALAGVRPQWADPLMRPELWQS